MKLLRDFGVTALFGTLIIIGSFVMLGLGLVNGDISASDILPMIGAWVGAVVGAYFVVKANKESRQ
jgi:hypothetical protein